MEYKDRSIGLVVFGVLTIALGALCALLIAAILATQLMPPSIRTPMALLLPALAVYAGMAAALTWLGIGSILARRWARALLLIFSWSWLVMGVLVMILMAVTLPAAMASAAAVAAANGRPAAPAGMMDGMMAIAFLFDGTIFVVVPAVWTFFYGSRHVKATCEARHPAPAWTDACPLPVLALVLWLLFSTPSMLLMPLMGFSFLPFFGTFLTGAPAAILLFALGGLWILCAWMVYRLDPRGWWLTVIAFGLMTVSTLITYSRHSIFEIYRLMNFPPQQLAQLQKSPLFQGSHLTWTTALFLVPMLGYLLFVRRYFLRPAQAA